MQQQVRRLVRPAFCNQIIPEGAHRPQAVEHRGRGMAALDWRVSEETSINQYVQG